jgi:glycosyltransferase involved in cell wall biosynthesis
VRLLIDTVNAGSLGGFQLQMETARCARRCRPDGAEVVFLRAPESSEVEESDAFRVVTHPRAGGWSGLRRWYARQLPALAREHGADVVYALSGILSDPLYREFGTVSSINNMLPFTPELMRNFPVWSRGRIRLLLLQRAFVRAARKADAVVFPSRHGLETVTRYAGPLSDKAFLAPNPVPDYVRVDPSAPPPHPNEGRPFLFYLSVASRYKNHLNLVEAYRRAAVRGADLPPLLMAGPPADQEYLREILVAIDAAGLGERVRWLGKVPREQIPGWLHHATINVFASTCETSSFIQAEILGAGGVMACSSVPPMPEVAGGAAELFDPYDPDSIAGALIALWSAPQRRRELRARARELARGLTVEACGDVIWAASRRAYESRGGSRSAKRRRISSA